MPVPVWPAALPKCTLREAWGMEPQSAVRRTEMDDGSVAQTRRFSLIRTVHGVAWRMRGPELDAFKLFWRDDLSAGALWFDLPMMDALGERTRRARFVEPWRAAMEAPGLWRVDAKLETQDLPTG